MKWTSTRGEGRGLATVDMSEEAAVKMPEYYGRLLWMAVKSAPALHEGRAAPHPM